ncbi:MAG: hypothetical protein PUP92_40475 [Rhizonema sp. PD38]|nr:hypothetical protein [Rhizonema sp. PD38]
MNSSRVIGFHDNNFSDRRPQSVVIAIANASLSSLNEQIAEASLDQNYALTATTSAITAFWLDMGRKFADMKQALKPKEKFRDLVEAMGRTVTFVNKLIRATNVADNSPIATAYMLGIDILAQLAQPKYADLIDDFTNHPPENQLEASDRIKEFARSQPKKPKTPWIQRSSAKTSDGSAREYQAPILSETAGLIIELESENTGMPPRVFVEKAVQAQSLRQSSPGEASPGRLWERVLSPASFAFVEPKAISEELEVVAAVAEHHKAEAEELKIAINELELEKTSTETTLAQIVETAIALPINLIKAILPFSKLSSKGPENLVASSEVTAPIRELIPIGAARKPKSEKFFAIGEMVMHCGVIYTVESLPDADGDVECKMANGRSRHLAVQFLKKCEVS